MVGGLHKEEDGEKAGKGGKVEHALSCVVIN
jgi:hypothetical protein